jgi:hypothetical protein
VLEVDVAIESHGYDIGAARVAQLPAGDVSTANISITSAVGWWWLQRIPERNGSRTVRSRVACWQLATAGEWNEVRPLIAADGAALCFVEDSYSDADGWLLHDSELPLCHCGRLCWHDAAEVDDVRWCESCGGVIQVV